MRLSFPSRHHHRRDSNSGDGSSSSIAKNKADPMTLSLTLPLVGSKQVATVMPDSNSNSNNSRSSSSSSKSNNNNLLLWRDYQKQREHLVQRQRDWQDKQLLLLQQERQQDDKSGTKEPMPPATATTTTKQQLHIQTNKKLQSYQQALLQLDYDWQGMLLRQVLPPVDETLKPFEQEHSSNLLLLLLFKQKSPLSSAAAVAATTQEHDDVVNRSHKRSSSSSSNHHHRHRKPLIIIKKKYAVQECLGPGQKLASSTVWRVQPASCTMTIKNKKCNHNNKASLAMQVYSKADLLLLLNNSNKKKNSSDASTAAAAAMRDLVQLRYDLQWLQELSHPNLLHLYDIWNGPSNLYVITELEWMTVSAFQETYKPSSSSSSSSSNGSSSSCSSTTITTSKHDEWTTTVCTIARGVLQALVYLHEQVGICHGNIQANNIVLVAATVPSQQEQQQQRQQKSLKNQTWQQQQQRSGSITVDQVRLINLSPPPPSLPPLPSLAVAVGEDDTVNQQHGVVEDRNDSSSSISSDKSQKGNGDDLERGCSNQAHDDDLRSLGVTLLDLLKTDDDDEDNDEARCSLREWIQKSWMMRPLLVDQQQQCYCTARTSLAQLMSRRFVVDGGGDDSNNIMFLEDKSFC